MAFCSPSTKLSVVVHVGPLSGVLRRENQPTSQPISYSYELQGMALDVCRQIVTQTSTLTEPYIRLTKDALGDAGAWESLTLVPDLACIVVGNDDADFLDNC